LLTNPSGKCKEKTYNLCFMVHRAKPSLAPDHRSLVLSLLFCHKKKVWCLTEDTESPRPRLFNHLIMPSKLRAAAGGTEKKHMGAHQEMRWSL